MLTINECLQSLIFLLRGQCFRRSVKAALYLQEDAVLRPGRHSSPRQETGQCPRESVVGDVEDLLQRLAAGQVEWSLRSQSRVRGARFRPLRVRQVTYMCLCPCRLPSSVRDPSLQPDLSCPSETKFAPKSTSKCRLQNVH